MKVTKIIREYIEEKINAKYSPMIEAVKAKYDDADKTCEETKEAVRKSLEQCARDEFRKALAEFYSPEDLEELLPHDINNQNRNVVSSPYRYSIAPKHAKARAEEIDALQNKRDKAIRNVLIGLELGGTKQDLDRLLEEALSDEEV